MHRLAQQQLIQSEKMASAGQLAAGVAREIKNSLGTILLYSHMILEKLEQSRTAGGRNWHHCPRGGPVPG